MKTIYNRTLWRFEVHGKVIAHDMREEGWTFDSRRNIWFTDIIGRVKKFQGSMNEDAKQVFAQYPYITYSVACGFVIIASHGVRTNTSIDTVNQSKLHKDHLAKAELIRACQDRIPEPDYESVLHRYVMRPPINIPFKHSSLTNESSRKRTLHSDDESCMVFAINVNDKRPVHISQVNSGLCECTCFECGKPLVAKKGKINAWHFSHGMRSRCNGGEGALHLYAKQLLADKMSITLPDVTLRAIFECEQDTLIEKGKAERFNSVTLEDRSFLSTGFIPDAVGHTKDTQVLIEFADSHFIDDVKLAKLIKVNLPVLEVSLNGLDLTQDIEVLNHDILHKAKRAWVWHPLIGTAKQNLLNATNAGYQKMRANWARYVERLAYLESLAPLANKVHEFGDAYNEALQSSTISLADIKAAYAWSKCDHSDHFEALAFIDFIDGKPNGTIINRSVIYQTTSEYEYDCVAHCLDKLAKYNILQSASIGEAGWIVAGK